MILFKTVELVDDPKIDARVALVLKSVFQKFKAWNTLTYESESVLVTNTIFRSYGYEYKSE